MTELWNELTPGEAAKYNKQARAQAQRYDAEMREYKSIEKKAMTIREELEDLGWTPHPLSPALPKAPQLSSGGPACFCSTAVSLSRCSSLSKFFCGLLVRLVLLENAIVFQCSSAQATIHEASEQKVR